MDKTIVFIDFDGTITMEDTLVGAIRLFSDPGEFQEYSEKLEKGEMTLSQVVRYAFDNAPSSLLPQMLEYIDKVEIRPGFSEFLDEMGRMHIPVVVISGGVRQFSERKLAPYRERFTQLHAVDLDVSGPKMKLISRYDDGNELLKKTDVMALYDYGQSIGVGDSFTDMNMAKAVDTVFARDILARYLDKLGKPYYPYETFYDVTRVIQEEF
ncbi:MAG: haloacid dehalogenase-like hydrolase [Blautia sp.]